MIFATCLLYRTPRHTRLPILNPPSHTQQILTSHADKISWRGEKQEETMNGPKTPREVTIQLPEIKMVTETGTMSGPLVSGRPEKVVYRRTDVIHVVTRLMCLLTSALALSLMATAKEAAIISVYGFNLPVYSKWSFSYSFEYLVGVSAAVAVHSLLQLLIGAIRLLRNHTVILSRYHAWLIFAGDQVFAYAMMSAGSAASGVTNLNHTGIRHSPLPNFCKTLHRFCDRVAISIALTFFSCLWLTVSVVLDVIWLSKS